MPIDRPHDFSYVPDIARAVELLLQAPDADFGQVWHLPSAPTTTARQLVEIGAASLGVSPKVFSFPLGTLRLLGLVMPLAKELGRCNFSGTGHSASTQKNSANGFHSSPRHSVKALL